MMKLPALSVRVTRPRSMMRISAFGSGRPDVSMTVPRRSRSGDWAPAVQNATMNTSETTRMRGDIVTGFRIRAPANLAGCTFQDRTGEGPGTETPRPHGTYNPE